MEEDEYKVTYHEIAQNRCVFEKVLTSNQGKCRYSQHFWLADREGYACKSREISLNCRELLERLRKNSKFLLKLHSIGDQLPHNMEIRVEVGGLRGLRAVFGSGQKDEVIADIRALIEQTEQQYDNMDVLPYSEIVQSIASFQGRKRGKHRQNLNND
ncbi:MAG: hypothetical protein OEZ15_02690 [Gammaproteobacteria bacterium]|nr:hypothetical protein [Gammaproteobacteria bacterium]